VLGIHASAWAAGYGNPDATAAFLNSAGILANTHASTWDVVFNDVDDHDAGWWEKNGGSHWWTQTNFTTYLAWVTELKAKTNRQQVVWQVPIGNQYFLTMNNTCGHYQDNVAPYFIAHPSDLFAAGLVAVLFGAGNSCQTVYTDGQGDGITNNGGLPTTDLAGSCNACNTHTSVWADDDGGYLRIFVGQYYATASTIPTISGLAPNNGPTAGGTSVVITGTNLTGATAVKFGTLAAVFTVNSASQITATSPPGTAGIVDVMVTTANGTSAISTTDQFAYTGPPPTLIVIAPTNGPAGGGTPVAITGTFFTGATAVKLGTLAATTYTVNSDTQITATSPPGTGVVDVRVTTTGGTTPIVAADQFTYVSAPTVASVAPNSGLTSGGTPVTITGTNLTGATAVRFGTTNAAIFAVISATQITATSPPGFGTVDVTVTAPGGSSAVGAADRFTYTAPPAAYTAQSPNRILDTRASAQTLGAGASLNLTVAGGTTGIPASATGVVLNVTVTGTTAPSFLTVWPAGQARATVSNLNWKAGETRANLVNVSVGAGGQVSIYNGVGSADVVVDEEGYFAAPSGTAGGYNALPPARLLDTRPSQTMSTGSTIDLPVLGVGGVPATGVSAVVLNATATNTASQGFFTLFPSGTSRPTASNVNWAAGWTIPNRVIVKVGGNGKVSIYNGQGAADAVIDVSGYFTDSTASGKFFTQLSPVRVLDTRVSGGTLGPNGTLANFQITGSNAVPAGATAVFLNTTVTNTSAPSFLTVFPNAPKPTASDLNWVAGQTIPNLTLGTLSSSGTTSFYNGVGSTDLVLDLSGYFT
jgi:hypothetical protein